MARLRAKVMRGLNPSWVRVVTEDNRFLGEKGFEVRPEEGLKPGDKAAIVIIPDSAPEGAVEGCDHKQGDRCYSQPVLEDCPGEDRCVSWLQRALAAARAELAGREERVVWLTRGTNQDGKVICLIAHRDKVRGLGVSLSKDGEAARVADVLGIDRGGRWGLRHLPDAELEEKVRPWRLKHGTLMCSRCHVTTHPQAKKCWSLSCGLLFGEPRPLPEGEEADDAR